MNMTEEQIEEFENKIMDAIDDKMKGMDDATKRDVYDAISDTCCSRTTELEEKI